MVLNAREGVPHFTDQMLSKSHTSSILPKIPILFTYV